MKTKASEALIRQSIDRMRNQHAQLVDARAHVAALLAILDDSDRAMPLIPWDERATARDAARKFLGK